MRTGNDGSTLGMRPDSIVSGVVRVPGSKSIAQRFLIQAALASGTTRLTRLPDGDDVTAAVALIKAAKALVERPAPAALSITGRPPGPHRGWKPDVALHAGESGTLARFATAASGFCALAGHRTEIAVAGTLAERRSTALLEALRDAGVRVESASGATWPLSLIPIGPPSRVCLREPRSSQEVSALLVALAAYPDELELDVLGPIPSRPYLELSIDALARFGVRVSSAHPAATSTKAGERARSLERFTVRGPLVAPPDPIAIEPDASAAAVALAAGVLSGGRVRVAGLHADSKQGDVRIVEHLRAFGARSGFDDEGVFAEGAVTRGADLDLEREPDLAPVLAALAARAAWAGLGPSRLTGLATLPGKESSRIEVLAAGLSAIGLEAEAGPDFLSLSGARTGRYLGEPLDPHADHRMAFAFALFGLSVPGVNVRDPECVAKSWPTFWTDLSRAGAHVASEPATTER